MSPLEPNKNAIWTTLLLVRLYYLDLTWQRKLCVLHYALDSLASDFLYNTIIVTDMEELKTVSLACSFYFSAFGSCHKLT